MSDNVKNNRTDELLSDEKLSQVSGGLNPQPLPPGEIKVSDNGYRTPAFHYW
jgi:bacteriocin-like protein